MNRCGSMLISARRVAAALGSLQASFGAYYGVTVAGGPVATAWTSREGLAGASLDLANGAFSAPNYEATGGMFGGPAIRGSDAGGLALQSGAYALNPPSTVVLRMAVKTLNAVFVNYIDGRANNTRLLREKTGVDTLEIFAGAGPIDAGDATACQADVGVWHSRTLVYNGAASHGDRDGTGWNTGDAGSGAATGLTLFNRGDGLVGADISIDGAWLFSRAIAQGESTWFSCCVRNRKAP